MKIRDMLIAVIAVAALAGCSNAAAEPNADAQRITACHNEVQAALKAPSTAQFTGDDTQREWEPGAKSYKVTGSVDAQNTYGAQIRSPYWCIVQAADLSITGSKVGAT